MLVHSFSRADSSFDDFKAFADAIRLPLRVAGEISSGRTLEGAEVRLGWVKDQPLP